MAGTQNSNMGEPRKRGRGRPANLAVVANNEGNSNADTNTGSAKPRTPKRDTFKVYSVKMTEDVQAAVVRHGKDIENVLVKSGNNPWEQLTDSEGLFYKMISRAAKSKSSGAKLVGVYYDKSMALLPSNLVTQPAAPKPTE